MEAAGINEFEHIRENLRDLIKYIPVSKVRYDTNFDDEILSVDWKESELENDDLKNYKAKAEFYVRQHMNDAVIAKLKGNVPLTVEDVQALEKALWSEVGTKQDYEAEYGQKPLGEFVREIVGLDMNAAKEAFAQYLNDASLDSRQIYFVNQIVEYIVHNGMMKDLSVLQEVSVYRLRQHRGGVHGSYSLDGNSKYNRENQFKCCHVKISTVTAISSNRAYFYISNNFCALRCTCRSIIRNLFSGRL